MRLSRGTATSAILAGRGVAGRITIAVRRHHVFLYVSGCVYEDLNLFAVHIMTPNVSLTEVNHRRRSLTWVG